jgi:hypothetical protein
MKTTRIDPFFKTLPSEKKISKVDVERAIYIDFEGFMKHPPSLIGIMCEDDFWQVVLVEDLILAAQAKNIKFDDGKNLISNLIHRAVDEDRKIVAYSSFEKEQCHRWYDLDISSLYVNANLVARSWKKIAFPQEKISGLKDYLKLINYPRGDHLGIKQSTQRIKSVSEMIAKKGSYELLTTTQKGKWTRLLNHNRIDVEGMKALMLRATNNNS